MSESWIDDEIRALSVPADAQPEATAQEIEFANALASVGLGGVSLADLENMRMPTLLELEQADQ